MEELKNHILFRHSNTIIAACSPLSKLSIDGFIFMRRFPDGSFIDLSNQLEWSEDFLNRYLIGNVDVKNAQDHMLIQPGISLWSHNPENLIWKEGSSEWGFHSGISIAKKGPSWMDIFCFYSRKIPLDMDAKLLKNFCLLESFMLFFVDRFHKIIKEGENYRLMTPSIYLSCDETFSLEEQKFSKSLSPQRELLSTREKECIFYIAKGNTAAEVGEIMHLSRRTIEAYLQSAKDKICVKRTVDLVKLFPEW